MTATRWLVDAGPLTTLASQLRPEWHWPAGALAVTALVEREARRGPGATGPPTPRERLLDRATDGRPWITVHRVAVPSPAGQAFARLSQRLDPGEAESIAWCAHESTDAVFVTQDKTAAFVALAELGLGRVALPFDLWCALRDAGLIDREAFDRL